MLPAPLCERAAQLGMPAVAITDPWSLLAITRFARAAHTAGVRPVFGAEIVIDVRTDTGAPCSLILLAETHEGYRNLCRLLTTAARPGAFVPVSLDTLAARADGLIALSTGETAMHEPLADIFDDTHLYVTLGSPKESDGNAANEHARSVAARLHRETVVAMDCRYLQHGDADIRRAVRAHHLRARLDDPASPTEDPTDAHLHAADEVTRLLPHDGAAIERTGEIAARCSPDLPHTRAPIRGGTDCHDVEEPALALRRNVLRELGKARQSHQVAGVLCVAPRAARATLMAAARVLGWHYDDAIAVARTLPSSRYVSLGDVLRGDPTWLGWSRAGDRVDGLVGLAEQIDGLIFDVGQLSDAIVFSDQPLVDFAPIVRSDNGHRLLQMERDGFAARKLGCVRVS